MTYNRGMDAYPMFKRCWDRQPARPESHMCSDIWTLLLAEHMISRETVASTPTVCVESDMGYPGAYSLDDTEAGRAIFI